MTKLLIATVSFPLHLTIVSVLYFGSSARKVEVQVQEAQLEAQELRLEIEKLEKKQIKPKK